MADQPKDHAEFLRGWAADIRTHSGGNSVDAERLESIAAYINRLQAAVSDFAAIYSDIWGADDKRDADVCEAFEKAILRHGL